MSNPIFLEDLNAATQAIADLNQLATRLSGSSSPEISPAGVSAAAAVANVAINAAGLGASLATPAQVASKKNQILEISIRNMSTTFSVVPYVFSPSRIDVSNIPGLLLPGASDVLLLTDEEGDAFEKNKSYISIQLLVNQVTVTVSYSLTDQQDPHLWYPQFEINNKTSSFTGDRTLKAATYQNFSMYTLPIDTKSGALDLTFMDLAS